MTKMCIEGIYTQLVSSAHILEDLNTFKSFRKNPFRYKCAQMSLKKKKLQEMYRRRETLTTSTKPKQR